MMNAFQKTLVLVAMAAGLMVGPITAVSAERNVIANGQAIKGFTGRANSMWVGRFYVPAGATRMIVTTSSGRGDCDLYLRQPSRVGFGWDFRSQGGNNDEKIVINRPAQGWWRIGLIGATDYSGLTLQARFFQPVVGPVKPPVKIPVKPPVKHPHGPHGGRIRRLGDEFEPNSKRELATQILDKRPQQHTINPSGDEDWILFVPEHPGKHVIEFTNVTLDLEGELWTLSEHRRDGHDHKRGHKHTHKTKRVEKLREERIDKFKIRRGRKSAVQVDVGPRVRALKIRIQADDNDDTGIYRISVGCLAEVKPGPKRPGPRRGVIEVNDTRERPIRVLVGRPQVLRLFPRKDEDWLLFAPERAGEYMIHISNANMELKAEIWGRKSGEKEKKFGTIDIPKSGRAHPLSIKSGMRYFKIKIEADDDDDTGPYRVEIIPRVPHRRSVIVHPPVRNR